MTATNGRNLFVCAKVNMHLPNGLLNVSACKYDSPAYVSFPHFYLADPALLDQFHPDSDLNPNEEEHSAYLSLMPKQGIPLEVAIRMQINILYRYEPTQLHLSSRILSGRSQGSQSTCLRTRNQRSTRRSGSKQPLSCLMILLASFVFSSMKNIKMQKEFLFNNLPGGFLLWATSWAASLPGWVFSLSLRSMQTEVAGSEFSQVSSILIRSCKVAWAISSLKVATTCDKAC